MSDLDLHSLTGAHAANALPPDEQALFVDHLAQCASCAEEAAGLVATTARLASAVAQPAPPSVRAHVLREIQQTRQMSPLGNAISLDQARRSRDERRWHHQPFAVAASLLAVVAVGLGGVAIQADRRAERAERIVAVASDPQAVTLTSKGPGGATTKVIAARGQGVFSARSLPELPASQDYQLWVIGDEGEGSTRSVGVLERGSDGEVEVLVSDLDAGESVGVTIEPSGGSDAPTTPPLMVLTLTA